MQTKQKKTRDEIVTLENESKCQTKTPNVFMIATI